MTTYVVDINPDGDEELRLVEKFDDPSLAIHRAINEFLDWSDTVLDLAYDLEQDGDFVNAAVCRSVSGDCRYIASKILADRLNSNHDKSWPDEFFNQLEQVKGYGSQLMSGYYVNFYKE